VSVLLKSVFDIKAKDLLKSPPNQNQCVCPKASFGQGEESHENHNDIQTKLLVSHKHTPGWQYEAKERKNGSFMGRWITEGEYATQPAVLEGG